MLMHPHPQTHLTRVYWVSVWDLLHGVTKFAGSDVAGLNCAGGSWRALLAQCFLQALPAQAVYCGCKLTPCALTSEICRTICICIFKSFQNRLQAGSGITCPRVRL